MSRSQQIGKVVQGDAVVTNATWLPSLNFIKKDDKLEIVTNPDQFQFSSELTLDDTFYSRTAEVVNPQQVVDNTLTKYLEFEFLTANITNTASMFITIPVQWQLTYKETNATFTPARNARMCMRSLSGRKMVQTVNPTPATLNYFLKPSVVPGPILQAYDITRNPEVDFKVTELVNDCFNDANFVAPNQYQIHLFKTCELLLGNNYISLGDHCTTNLSIIKALNTLCQQDEKFKDTFGMYNMQSGYSVYNNYDYVINERHLRCFYQNLTTTGFDVVNPLNTFGTADNFSITIPISVPLKMLHTFFHVDKYLPSGLPIKFKISLHELARVILMNPGLKTVTGPGQLDEERLNWAIKVQAINLHQAELRYQSNLLRQPIEDTLNRRWLDNPYLYNYITATKQSILTDGVSTKYYFNIAINQEIPLQLIIYMEANQVYRTASTFPYDNTRVLQWGFFDEDYADTDSTNAAGIPNNNANLSFMYEYVDTDNPLPMLIRSYELIVNGVRTKRNIKSDNYTITNLKNGTEILEDMVTYNAFNRSNLVNKNSIQNTNYGIGNYYHLTLDPGNFVDVDYRSTSVGSQTATLELEVFTKGISPYDGTNENYKISPSYSQTNGYVNVDYSPIIQGQRLTVVNVLPEQIRLDMNRNVTKIKFPAVASNNDASMQMSNIINAN